MYYELGNGNQNLDATDLANIASLYGKASTTAASAGASPATSGTSGYRYGDGDHTVSLTESGKVVSFGTGTDSLTIYNGGGAQITGVLETTTSSL